MLNFEEQRRAFQAGMDELAQKPCHVCGQPRKALELYIKGDCEYCIEAAALNDMQPLRAKAFDASLSLEERQSAQREFERLQVHYQVLIGGLITGTVYHTEEDEERFRP